MLLRHPRSCNCLLCYNIKLYFLFQFYLLECPVFFCELGTVQAVLQFTKEQAYIVKYIVHSYIILRVEFLARQTLRAHVRIGGAVRGTVARTLCIRVHTIMASFTTAIAVILCCIALHFVLAESTDRRQVEDTTA